jgi:hypothetical protein
LELLEQRQHRFGRRLVRIGFDPLQGGDFFADGDLQQIVQHARDLARQRGRDPLIDHLPRPLPLLADDTDQGRFCRQ